MRNVDRWIFGRHRARAMIDLPDVGERDFPRLQRILGEIEAGGVDAFYLHLAEGRRDNQRSVDEWDRLLRTNALTRATVIIHGTALGRAQLGDRKDAGAKLVWSPQSNLRLYGETTLAADALDVGLKVGLGADWLPTGSKSLLHELKIARRELARQGAEPPARRLVEMVTSDAAEIAGLGAELGSLEEGRPAIWSCSSIASTTRGLHITVAVRSGGPPPQRTVAPPPPERRLRRLPPPPPPSFIVTASSSEIVLPLTGSFCTGRPG